MDYSAQMEEMALARGVERACRAKFLGVEGRLDKYFSGIFILFSLNIVFCG